MSHIPVLLDEVLEEVKGMSFTPKTYLDGTFGRGGHASALRKLFPDMTVFALDQDQQAIDYARENFSSWSALHYFKGNFHHFKELYARYFSELLQNSGFDLMLLDLGVSSPQLDQGERGFSFYHEGPLDMRMDRDRDYKASDIVNDWSPEELTRLFQEYGEIRRPHRVVDKIVEERKRKLFSNTLELSSLVERVEGWRKKGQHPATNYFLALRLEVNSELDGLDQALVDLIEGLNEGGRLMVISFHSLEDRIVKNVFKEHGELGQPVHKKVIQAHWEEKKKNPRARSAKLRVFERGRVK